MLATFKKDISSSIIVFFVALPLCLGIAMASGAPLFSGLIAGIIGGSIVGIASGSRLGVSGPAAGLTVVVMSAIVTLGSWQSFLMALVLAGIIQLIIGYAKGGFIAYFFPSSVITGMLTGIGMLIVLKEIPYAIGYIHNIDKSMIIDFHNHSVYTYIKYILQNFITFGALIISLLSFAILIIWETPYIQKYTIFKYIQGPVFVIFIGILMNLVFKNYIPDLYLSGNKLVSIPTFSNVNEFFNNFSSPNMGALYDINTYKIAFVIAIIASLETLLCVEATDKLDSKREITSTNRELKAQGLGNIISGLIGGLPITQVVVRSSANITFGAETKMSTILHGMFLLISVVFMVRILNLIPLSSLAPILILVGYKLISPKSFVAMLKLGYEQFIPFIFTIFAMLLTNLLDGVLLGLGLSLVFTLYHSYKNSYYMKSVTEITNGKERHHIVLAEEVTFFNKASIIDLLRSIKNDSKVIIDCTNTKSIAYDVVEFITEYCENANLKNIEVETINFKPIVLNKLH